MRTPLARWPDKRSDRERREAAAAASRRWQVTLRLLCAAPFFALAGFVAFDCLPADRAWPVLALAALGFLIAIVPREVWRQIALSVSKAQIGPVGFELQRDLEKAVAIAPVSDRGEGGDPPPENARAETMFDLRLRLEFKLAYAAKHLLADSRGVTFLTVGSLEYDGYLTRAEARTAIGILSTRDEQLNAMGESGKEAFLKEAEKFVDSVRASIFWGQVKRCLQGKDQRSVPSLWIGDIERKGERDDLLAGTPGNEFWVAPAFGIAADSKIRKGAEARLRTEKRPYGVPAHRRIVVLPDVSKFQGEREPGSPPEVVRLIHLRETIEGSSQ